MQQQKNDKTTCLLLALTTIFWGSLYTASKVLLDVIQPFTLLCLRYIIAAIAMTILQRLRKPDPNGKPRRIRGGDWKYVIMFGLGGYVLSIGLQQYGTKLAGASLASLINCMNPIAICFFAVLLLHERMTMKKVVCIVSAVAGAVCIVGGDAGGGHILGIALSLGSVLTWSALSVFMRSFTQKYDALTVTTCGIYVAAIGTLPLCSARSSPTRRWTSCTQSTSLCCFMWLFSVRPSCLRCGITSLPCRGEHLFSVLPDSAAHLDGARCPAAERAHDGRLYCRCGAYRVRSAVFNARQREKQMSRLGYARCHRLS